MWLVGRRSQSAAPLSAAGKTLGADARDRTTSSDRQGEFASDAHLKNLHIYNA